MLFKNVNQSRSGLGIGLTWQTHNGEEWQSPAKCEILEMPVNGKNYPLLPETEIKNIFIRHFLDKFANPHHVMTFLGEEVGDAPTHVDINNESQVFSSFEAAAGKTSSSATRCRA